MGKFTHLLKQIIGDFLIILSKAKLLRCFILFFKDRDSYLNQPHYLILVDEKYQQMYSNKAYLAQDDIEVDLNSKVMSRYLNLII